MKPEWTTEYPKQSGYYWIRNYWISRRGQTPTAAPTIVEVEPSLDFYFFGDDDFYRERHVLQAEWLGPIQLPEEDK